MRCSSLVGSWTALGLVFVAALRGSEPARWPQFRGPHGTFLADAENLPVEVGPEKNVLWKVALAGHSAATPAVWDDAVYVMTPDGDDVFLVALSAEGQERWRRRVGGGNRTLGFNKKNNFASASPATDGEFVWAMAGSGDLACFNAAGELVWAVQIQDLLGPYETGFGFGFSPLLYGDALYLPYLHQGESAVAAIDKRTGKIKWRTPRTTTAEEESKDAYTTPCVFEYGDRAEVIICGADLVNAYDSVSGQETWRHGDINPTGNKTLRIVVSPVADRERIYVSTAKRGPVYAIQPGGTGDVTQSHRVWTRTEDTPDVPSPAVADGILYVLRENGVLSALDAATCEEFYRERVARQSGPFSASPVVADGKVYLASESGLVVVVAAGKKYQHLSESEFGELIMATPAIAGRRIFLRTTGHLICLGRPS